MSSAGRCAIAIPARNEAALLPRCLDALAAQTVGSRSFFVVILANNCTDDTAEIARRYQAILPLHVIETTFPPDLAHAGSARRAAMNAAAAHGDIVLTTDADCVPDADWVEAMCAAFGRGVDAIAGRVSGDWSELQHQPEALLAIGALEWEYLALIGEAEATFDPQPHDPAPHHAQRCGANIGITRAMLHRVGGVPAIATGEDRALLDAVERAGGKIRHDPCSHVTASARVAGRATGGMADALARRGSDDYLCDAQFEPADDLVARLTRRRLARAMAADPAHAELADSPQPARLRPARLRREIDRLRALIGSAHAQ